MDIGKIMHHSFRKIKPLILLFLVTFFVGGFLIYQNFYNKQTKQGINTEFKNFILIGWDGVQREQLHELLNEGKLPNLEKLIKEGVFVNTVISTGKTETKPGWAEILTGYNAENLGIYSNFDYKPIPKGFTIFERLEDHFGKENIATVFISGKDNNTGARGPHKICLNCFSRDPLTRQKLTNIVENLSESEQEPLVPRVPGEDMIFEQREGEPYYYTKDSLDVYLSNLGRASEVGSKAIDYLEQYQKERFFMFFHFEEPDEQGHKYGENSIEYSNGLISDDEWLGKIVSKLKEQGIYDKTLIYVTTDHGFEEGGFEHHNEPDTFLATNDKAVKRGGDRKDITPTILHRYNIDTNAILPTLDGVSLMEALKQPVRIGYFPSGRTCMIYRAYINKYFDQEGVDIRLYTAFLRETEFLEVPKDEEERRKITEGKRYFGTVSGEEIIDKIMMGEFDGGTVGGNSFVASVNKGAPLVAVALLGYDASPGKAIIMRSDVKINSPDDLKGKTLISPRSGPGTAIFLREFLKSVGLDSEKDVTIIDQVDEDDAERLFSEKKIDGGLYNIGSVRRLVSSGMAYIYQPMDWINSELSQGLLVFRKDYAENHREEIQRLVNAYIRRIAYEKNLPEEERDKSWDKELMMEGEFQGLRTEKYSLPPRVRIDLLEGMQDLLYKYGNIDEKVSMSDFVDYSFVEEAMGIIK